MPDLTLVTTVAAAFSAAWFLGLLTQRLRLSPIGGYLLAGVVIGPHTPGFVGDVGLAHQLAEIGVILLMFGVGMHFHPKDLLAVRAVAVPGAVAQIACATGLGAVLFSALGLPLASGVALGLALSVASTVVLIRMLRDSRRLDAPEGAVAVGWLLVEDVFTVVALVLLPAVAAGGGDPARLLGTVGIALLKLVALVGLVLLVGARAVPWILVQVARLRSRELFTLTVLVFSVALAAGAYLAFGASLALGAFLAGTMVALSPTSHQIAADALPLRDAFSVVFFVSVGMLFDPASILERPDLLLGALAIILVAKPAAALAIVALLGHSSRTALTAAVGLAQVGEFSFILSELAHKHGLLEAAGHDALIGAAILSITLNPFLFRVLPRMEAYVARHPRLGVWLDGRARRGASLGNAAVAQAVREAHAGEAGLAVIVGYGPVGQSVDRLLREAGLETVIIDMNLDTVAALQARGRRAIFGDATRGQILEDSGIARASHLILTLPDPAERTAVVSAARHLNPSLPIFVRARYLGERRLLEQAGATAAVFEEAEAAVALARRVLADSGVPRDAIERSVREVRRNLVLAHLPSLGTRPVSSVMIPWDRVQKLQLSMSRSEVLGCIVREHFSRWPVEGGPGSLPLGYVAARDLVEGSAENEDWRERIRPLLVVAPDTPVQGLLGRLAEEGHTLALVAQDGVPLGLFILDDLLERGLRTDGGPVRIHG